MRKLWLNKIWLLFIIVFQSHSIYACDCPTVPKLDKAYTDGFKLIFRGAVKSVGTCNEINKAHFIIQELYKGDSPKEIDVYFDCTSDCKMQFNPGETWIIYAELAQIGKPKAKLCSRSRKLVDNEIKVATNFIASDLNFNEESDWLKSNLGIKSFLAENDNSEMQHRNQLPSKSNALLLIGVSLGGLLLVYVIMKRFLK